MTLNFITGLETISKKKKKVKVDSVFSKVGINIKNVLSSSLSEGTNFVTQYIHCIVLSNFYKERNMEKRSPSHSIQWVTVLARDGKLSSYGL